MRRVAVLVDLGFFLPRYRTLIEKNARPRHSPKQVARALRETALRHIESREQLYRIFVYDCRPLEKKTHNPISGRVVDFGRSEACLF